MLGRRGRGAAERAALARAAARLARLGLYPEPLRTERVRLLHVPWLFALPWFRRFAGYSMGHLILFKRPLADELLFGKLIDGGRVTVDVRDGELVVEAKPEPEKLLPATVE